MSIQDRLYVDVDDKRIIDILKDNNILDINSKSNKEIFLLALSLGLNLQISIPIENNHELVRLEYLNDVDMTRLKMCALYKEKDIKILDDMSKVYEICQEYARGGLQVLESKCKNDPINNFDKEFELNLKEKYEEDIIEKNRV